MSESAPQRRVGKYRILKELGKGSFGVTSLAEHVSLGTRVVLKELKVGEGGDSTSRARFIEEARIQAKLGAMHKGIAQVTELEEDADPPYYVVEYCDQGDLAKLVEKTGPLPPVHVMRIIRQVADSLSCAHRLVLHRDLKPQNLVLGSAPGTGIEPIIKLIDFGLARPIDQQQVADAMMTAAGQMLGTVLFTAPEQLRSDENLDCRCDIFSLGMTAWYLLEGGAPVSGTSGQILTERLSPASYDDAVPQELPGDFRQLLCRMLAKRASDRPSTALDVIREIDRCLTGVSVAWSPLVEMEKPEDNSQQSLEDLYEVSSEGTTVIGKTLLAKVRSTGRRVHLHALEGADRAVIATLSQYAGRTRSTGCPHLPIMKMELLKGGWVVAEELLEGATDLNEVICETKALNFPTAAPLLRYLADACDAVKAADLVHFPVTIKSVELCVAARRWMDVLPTGKFRLRLRSDIVALMPGRKSMSIIADPKDTIGATLDPNVGAGSLSVAQRFLRTAYWVLAGKEPRPAAFYSSSDCDPIRGLNEETNMLFRRHLSGASLPEDRPCSYFLEQICHAQGVAMPKPYDAEAEMAEHITACEDTLEALIQEVAPCAQWTKNLPVTGMASDESVAMMSLATTLMGKVEDLRNQLRDLEAQTGRSGHSSGATIVNGSGGTGGRLSGLTLGTEELHNTLRQTIADAQAMAEWWRCKRAADTSQHLLASIPSSLQDIQARFDQFKFNEGLPALESIERQVLSLRNQGLPESDPVILPPDVATRLPQVFSDKLAELNSHRASLAQEATKAIQSLPELLDKIKLGKKTLSITATADAARDNLEKEFQRAETLTSEAVESLSSSGSISTVGSPLVKRALEAVSSARAAAKLFLAEVERTPNQAQVSFFQTWRQQQRDFATHEAAQRLDICEAALAGAQRDLAQRVALVADNLRRQTDDCIRDAATRENELAACASELTRLKLESKGNSAALIGRLQGLERSFDEIHRKLNRIQTSANEAINTNPPTELRLRFESVRKDVETANTRLLDDIERIRVHSGDLQSVDSFAAELSSFQDELRTTEQMVKDLGLDIPKATNANQSSLTELIQPLAHADACLAKGASIEATLTSLRPKTEQLLRIGGQTGQAWAKQATDARNRIETIRGELDKLVTGLRTERRRLAQSATDIVAASQIRLSNLRSDANARSAEAANLAIAATDQGHADAAIWQQIIHERDLLRSRVTNHRSELDIILTSLELTSKLPSDIVLPTTDAAEPIRRALNEVDTKLNSIRQPATPGTRKKLAIAASIAVLLGLGVIFLQPLRKFWSELTAAPAALPMSSFVCQGGISTKNTQFYLAKSSEPASLQSPLKMDAANTISLGTDVIPLGHSVYAAAPGYEPKEIIPNETLMSFRGPDGKYPHSKEINLERTQISVLVDTKELDKAYGLLSFTWKEPLSDEPKAEAPTEPLTIVRTANATEESIKLKTGKYLVQALLSRGDQTSRPVAPVTNGWNLMVSKGAKPLICDKIAAPAKMSVESDAPMIPVSEVIWIGKLSPPHLSFYLLPEAFVASDPVALSSALTTATKVAMTTVDTAEYKLSLNAALFQGKALYAIAPGYDPYRVTTLTFSEIAKANAKGKLTQNQPLSLVRRVFNVSFDVADIPEFYDQVSFTWKGNLKDETDADAPQKTINTFDLGVTRTKGSKVVTQRPLPSGRYLVELVNSKTEWKGIRVSPYMIKGVAKEEDFNLSVSATIGDLSADLTPFNLSGEGGLNFKIPSVTTEGIVLPGSNGNLLSLSTKVYIKVKNGQAVMTYKNMDIGVNCIFRLIVSHAKQELHSAVAGDKRLPNLVSGMLQTSDLESWVAERLEESNPQSATLTSAYATWSKALRKFVGQEVPKAPEPTPLGCTEYGESSMDLGQEAVLNKAAKAISKGDAWPMGSPTQPFRGERKKFFASNFKITAVSNEGLLSGVYADSPRDTPSVGFQMVKTPSGYRLEGKEAGILTVELKPSK
jgi:serine/threonine protein kinase